MAPPFREVEFDILYGQGFSRAGDVLDLASEASIIEKSGAWFSFQGRPHRPKVGDNAARTSSKHPDVLDQKPRPCCSPNKASSATLPKPTNERHPKTGLQPTNERASQNRLPQRRPRRPQSLRGPATSALAAAACRSLEAECQCPFRRSTSDQRGPSTEALHLCATGPRRIAPPPGRDFDRRLTDRGKARTERVAKELGSRDESPKRVISSPLRRTVETAEIVIATLKLPVEAELRDELAPGGASFHLVEELQREAPSGSMLVGHEPDVSVLTEHLLPEVVGRATTSPWS